MQKTDQPLYLETADRLRSYLVEKGLTPGEKLPGQTTLAKKFNVATMTLRRAVEVLVDEGLLTRKKGSGTYLAQADASTVSRFHDFMIPHFLRDRTKTLSVQTPDFLPHQMLFWRDAARTYEKRNPGISVKVINGLQARKFDEPVPGDVVVAASPTFNSYVDNNLITPLSKPFLGKNLLPCFSETQKYGCPFSIVYDFMIFNADLSKKLGIDFFKAGNWDALSEIIRTGKNGKNTRCMSVSSTFAFQVLSDKNTYQPSKLARLPEKLKDVFIFFLEHKDQIQVWPADYEPDFINGKTLAAQSILWRSEPLSKRCPFKLGAFPFPGQKDRFYYSTVLCVSNTSENKAEAEDFARFCSSYEIQKLMTEHRYATPGMKKLQKKFFSNGPEGFESIRETLRSGTHRGPEYAKMAEYSETVFVPVAEKILHEQVSLDRGIDELKLLTEKLLQGEHGWHYAGKKM